MSQYGRWPSTSGGGGGTVTNIATGTGLTGGPITTTGTIAVATNGITNALLAQMAASTFKGNATGLTANASDLTGTQATALLDLFNATAKGLVPLSGGGSTNFLRADGTWAIPPGTGITQLTSDVTAGPGSGSQVATIAANAVTNAKAAQMAANTIKGNNTGGTANALDLTATQVTAMLNAFVGDSGSGGTKGEVPAPAAGDAAAGKFLFADGTWLAISFFIDGGSPSVNYVTSQIISGGSP